jgi:VWFA-related protein
LPIYLAVLIQDDVVSSINNEIKAIAEFIEKLPKGSRVMVGYIRSGSLQVRQKFTNETDKAIKALRIPVGSASAAPYNPYVEVIEALKRFDSQPTGRRAVLIISDGLDLSGGRDSSLPGQSVDLDRAINEAQRRSVAIYSIFAPTVTSSSSGSILTLNGQSSLNRLSDETGGYAYIQGTSAPVSFDPFLKDLGVSLYRQIALTYLSTHPKKGYHKIQVLSNQPNIKIDHPAGYTRK